jgi:16S rRNA (guanine527-N7)-methyltransferase
MRAASAWGLSLDSGQARTLSAYAQAVERANRLFNLTGCSSVQEIITTLVVGSILPLKDLSVPRGTIFCDMGTGAGVPGLVFALYRPDLRAVLIDSAEKKLKFIVDFCCSHAIDTVSVRLGRVEELARASDLRESFDFVLSRAMAAPYVALELGASLVKEGGFVYIYARANNESLHPAVVGHAESLGLVSANRAVWGLGNAGFAFAKSAPLNERYPRRYAVIAREAEKLS